MPCFSCCKAVNTCLSKHRPPLELEMLRAVAGLFVQRVAVTELERPDRRVPCQAHACRKPKRLELRLRTIVIDLAGIGEHRQPDRLIVCLGPRQWKEQFGVANNLAPAADRVALAVLRTQRRRIVAAYRTHATRIIRLEEWKRLVAEAAAVADVAAQHPDDIRRQRGEPLNQIV